MDTETPQKLFEDDEEDDDVIVEKDTIKDDVLPDLLNIENDYAKKYNDWRRKEELQKLKDKYGDQLDVMSEIDDEDNDDDGDGGDEESSSDTASVEEDPFDEDFFKVYSALKVDDPKLYDKNFKFFDDLQGKEDDDAKKNEKTKKKVKEEDIKTLTLPEYHRKLVVERQGITEEDEDQPKPSLNTNGYYEELSNIKDEIKNIVGENDDDDHEEEDEFFTFKETKEKVTTRTIKKPTEEKNKFLATFWSDKKKLDENEQFLRDYIVNQKYRDDEKSLLMSEAKRLTNVDNHFGGFDQNIEDVDQDQTTEKKPQIEVAKFHFEEQDATTIKRFPRNLPSVRDSVKQKTSKRAEKREKKRQEKESELKKLRRLKREEMEAKLVKLKQTAGIETPLDVKTLDLNIIVDDDAEFDPVKYDEKMKLLFGDEYYQGAEVSKPKFDYEPEIDDNLYDKQTDVMLQGGDEEEVGVDEDDSSKQIKKKKTKKEIKQNKDIMADDDIGIFDDLIDGELPVRFRYRMVEPNDFGLTDEEILMADDKELNRWVSLKKMSQYRPKKYEEYDKKVYQRKAADLELKKKILKSIYGNPKEGENVDEKEEDQTKKKKRGKKRRKSNKQQGSFQVTNIDETNNTDTVPKEETIEAEQKTTMMKKVEATKDKTNNEQPPHPMNKGKKRKRRGGVVKRNEKATDSTEIQRLKAYGMSKREIKRMRSKL